MATRLAQSRKEGTVSKIGLIIRREYSTRVRKKSFLVLTILMPVLIVGLMFLAMWLGLKDEKVYKALVADPAGWCGDEISYDRSGGAPVEFYFANDIIFGEDFLEDDKYAEYDLLIAIDDWVISNHIVKVLYREFPSARAQSFIELNVGNRLREHFAVKRGTISVEEYRAIQQNFSFSFLDAQTEEDGMLQQKAGVGLAFSILIFMFILLYSMLVMRGVIEEKSNRVVEIVVSSVKPFQLMMGKIIGIGLVGLTQFLIWVVVCFIGMTIIQTLVFPDMMNPENWQQVQEGVNAANTNISTGFESVGQTSDAADLLLRQIPWTLMIVMFLIYFVGGYLLYASLFAMIGSAVDNEADTQQLMWPVMLPLTFSYIVATTVVANPMGSTAVWFSMIPFTSPIVMLERISMNTFDNVFLELAISVLLLVGTAILMIWLAGKIYRVGILMYGKKVSWKEILRWMRY